MQQDRSIFQEIREKYNIVEVARNLGLIVKEKGDAEGSHRADSLAPEGGGKNALALYEKKGTWYDF